MKLEKVSKHWDENIKIHDNTEMKNWLDSPAVLDALPKLDGKYNPSQWILWSQERFRLYGKERGLSIGCGDGTLERHAIKFGIAKSFDGIDLSRKSIEYAREQAKNHNLDIDYYISDINDVILPHRYDVIYAGASLHHISNLEHLFSEIHRTLKPGGLFILNEFVGPNRFQWTNMQIIIINCILRALPKELKTMPNGRLKSSFSRPSLEEMAGDPSEAVRSEEILDLIYKNFNVIYRLDYGGTILNMLLYQIVHNFQISDIKPLASLEHFLIKNKIIKSDFCIIVAE